MNRARPRSLAALLTLGVPSLAFASGRANVPEACSLVDSEAFAEVLGTALRESRAGRRDGSGIAVTACFFVASNPGRSVSLELYGPGAGGEDAVRDRWRTLFEAASNPAEEAEEEDESFRLRREPEGERAEDSARLEREAREAEPEGSSESERARALAVSDVGDQAFWIGTSAYGALYVLQGDLYFRLSVGGEGGLDAKLALSRSLAQRILARLPRADSLAEPSRATSTLTHREAEAHS